mmetsp:Transcript_52647/g.163369  ORF Transcript_52647/g.163369 Transcript_52647/m.163369 type:complete len:225 (-) Transcript_52647:104-778(-)
MLLGSPRIAIATLSQTPEEIPRMFLEKLRRKGLGAILFLSHQQQEQHTGSLSQQGKKRCLLIKQKLRFLPRVTLVLSSPRGICQETADWILGPHVQHVLEGMQWCSPQEQEDWEEEATYEKQRELLSGAGDVEERTNRVVMEMAEAMERQEAPPWKEADEAEGERKCAVLVGDNLLTSATAIRVAKIFGHQNASSVLGKRSLYQEEGFLVSMDSLELLSQLGAS